MEHINRYIAKDIIDNNLIVIHNLIINEDYNGIINQILNIIKNKNAQFEILKNVLTNITEIKYIIKLCPINGYDYDDESVMLGTKYIEGLIKSLKVGSKELLTYFIKIREELNFRGLNFDMTEIIINNYNKIVKYTIDHGLATNYEYIMASAAYNNNKKMVKYMISKKAFNFNYCIYRASENNNLNLIDYLISCGAVVFNNPMYFAAKNNYSELVEYMIVKGATHFDIAIDIPTYYNNIELAEYLQLQLQYYNFYLFSVNTSF